MKRKLYINIVLAMVVLLLGVLTINMNNRIQNLEEIIQNQNNTEENLNSKFEFDNSDLIKLNNYDSLSEKINELEIKIENSLCLLEEYEEEYYGLDMIYEILDRYDLATLSHEIDESSYRVDILQDIIFSGDEYRVIVGKGVENNNENIIEIAYMLDGEEIIEEVNISTECKTFAVHQLGYGEIELDEFMEHLFFYEHENITLIEIGNEIKYMFQGERF